MLLPHVALPLDTYQFAAVGVDVDVSRSSKLPWSGEDMRTDAVQEILEAYTIKRLSEDKIV